MGPRSTSTHIRTIAFAMRAFNQGRGNRTRALFSTSSQCWRNDLEKLILGLKNDEPVSTPRADADSLRRFQKRTDLAAL